MIRAIMTAILLCGPAVAAPLDDVYDVVNVAPDDVLNIREMPQADSPIIGMLGPDATRIMILSETDGWGMVGVGENDGWVNMRYLTPTTNEDILPITCFGTEPFWDLSITRDGATLNQLDQDSTALTITGLEPIPNEFFVSLSRSGALDYLVNIRRGMCSDGMSDRQFGFQTSIFLTESAGGGAMRGCCSLDSVQ